MKEGAGGASSAAKEGIGGAGTKGARQEQDIRRLMKRNKEKHGHANVSIPKDKSLVKFCAQARHARKNPGKSKRKQLTSGLRCHRLELDVAGIRHKVVPQKDR